MIFVTVGTTSRPFHRLLDAMDRIAPILGEKVVAQTGTSPVMYGNMECQQYMSEEEMTRNYDDASLIVCHAGVGTIRNGLARDIPLVLVPRKASLDEVDTDHQMMIARKVVDMGKGVCVEDISQLERAIACARRLEFPHYEETTELRDFLSGLLSDIASERCTRHRDMSQHHIFRK